MYSVTDVSAPSNGGADSARARATPSAETTPLAASSSMSAGTPMNCLRGSERSTPRV